MKDLIKPVLDITQVDNTNHSQPIRNKVTMITEKTFCFEITTSAAEQVTDRNSNYHS